MIIGILAGVAVIIAALSIVIAMRPDDFRVSRSGTISAPAQVVFAQVNDLHLWKAWSPWERMDPNSVKTFEGPEAGVGASMAWVGKKSGEGRMTIKESHPDEFIGINLEFIKPFKARNVVEFSFKPQGDQTVVTWTMIGKNNFAAKAFGLIMDCEKMCGGQFEEGLANLKSVSESSVLISR